MTYTIEKVTALMGAHRYGQTACNIRWLLTDSRSLSFPEETLFFAIRTQRNDGHRYIGDLYRRGVRCFVVEELPNGWAEGYEEANFLLVPDTLKALQRLAERHRDEFRLPVVGITGSNGKTVVKEWLYQLLSGVGADAPVFHDAESQAGSIVRSPRSYNSQVGVPLSVWLLNEHSRVALFEAGISQPGEMQALHNIIQPTLGVFTTLGMAHQENFPSMEAKCREKIKLFGDAREVCYCADDALTDGCIRQSGLTARRLTWSRRDTEATLFVSQVEQVDASLTRVSYIYNGTEGGYDLPFIDEASIANSICCALVCLTMGLDPTVMARRMARLEPVAMRLEVKEGQRGCTLINDSYNSDVVSLDIALDFMNRRSDGLSDGETPSSRRRRTLILSDISQSGETPEALYAEVSGMAESRGIDRFIGIGPQLAACQEVIRVKERHFFETTEAFIESRIFRELHDEDILLKGARSFGFDRITDLLVRKVHETILEVNLNAVVENLNHYRSMMQPETKMVCMIKADAYGAGAVEIARTLQDHRASYLAVAVADEGVTLRKAGITANIMVMNPEMTSFKTLFDYRLEPEVYSFRLLDALIRAARKEGITQWPVHVKIDTGMHRLGFSATDDISRLIDVLQNQQALLPRSVFSHFVGSDSDDFDDFSALQFSRFDEASRRLQEAFPHKILRHIDNSAGIDHFPGRQLDMCRLGIGLYGVDPRTNQMLATVSTLRTTILQLRRVPKGDTVGYSRRGVLERDSVIAAIPIGYADGLNRHLGRGRGYCIVNGRPAPYVGNICMDVAMIDVTDIPCREGDTVEIFGPQLPVTVLAEQLDTIAYEVLTGISNRVKRIYFRD